jgi:predicted nucleic-acid-binding protein
VSTNEVIHKISLSGRNGIKRTEIRKEFQNIAIDEVVESLLKKGEVVIDKKGTAYYLWQADNYLQYLLMTDTRFRLLYDAVEETKRLVENKIRQNAIPTPADSTKSPSNNTEAAFEDATDRYDSVPGRVEEITFDKDMFRHEFDTALRRNPSSSGWVLLSRIREEMGKKCNIGQEEFYTLVENMTNKEYDTYELSSGGSEGITVRGLLHGFVRCI